MASNTRSIIQNYPNPKFNFFFLLLSLKILKEKKKKCKTLKIFVQARCISDVKADTDHTSFITGTLSLKEENEVYILLIFFFWFWFQFVFLFLKLMEFWGCLFQVHLIRVSSGGTELICEGLFSHPNEIWDLASCPFDQRIFSTVYSSGIWFHWSWSLFLFIYFYIHNSKLDYTAAMFT